MGAKYDFIHSVPSLFIRTKQYNNINYYEDASDSKTATTTTTILFYPKYRTYLYILRVIYARNCRVGPGPAHGRAAGPSHVAEAGHCSRATRVKGVGNRTDNINYNNITILHRRAREYNIIIQVVREKRKSSVLHTIYRGIHPNTHPLEHRVSYTCEREYNILCLVAFDTLHVYVVHINIELVFDLDHFLERRGE